MIIIDKSEDKCANCGRDGEIQISIKDIEICLCGHCAEMLGGMLTDECYEEEEE